MVYLKIEPAATRLGNWMFQYAAARSRYPNEPMSFFLTGGLHLDEPQKYSELWPDVQYVYELPEGSCPIIGLFQDARYLDEAVVRRVLKCPERVERHLQEKYADLLAGNCVGISVRRGDYLRMPHRHPFVGTAYLRKAIRFVESRIKVDHYVICSDDLAWCRNFFKGEKYVFIEGEDVLAQLYIHTKCRGGNIISNSSFSWWGAYLNEFRHPGESLPVVSVFPSMWFGLALNDDAKGLYFKGATVIENGYSFALWLHARICMLRNMLGRIRRRILRG